MSLSVWPCISHFPSKSGLITGILMAGFGIAPALWNLVLVLLMNPEDVTPDIPYKTPSTVIYLFGAEVTECEYESSLYFQFIELDSILH